MEERRADPAQAHQGRSAPQVAVGRPLGGHRVVGEIAGYVKRKGGPGRGRCHGLASRRLLLLPPLARGQHPERRVFGQPFGVVGVLVARQAAIDGLAEEIWERELAVVSGPRIAQMALDQRAQAEALV